MGVKRYRVLLIGCGQIAGLFDKPASSGGVLSHAQAYCRDSRFQLAACVEPDAERRKAFAGTWNVPESFASVDEAFAGAAAYDVVSICAPTAAHAAILIDLATRPVRAVFAEKPLLGGKHETTVLDPFRQNGAPILIVNYTRRWDREIETLRELAASGEAGACRSVTVFYNKGVRNNASHAIHLLSYVFGFDPRAFAVDAVGRWRRDHFDDDPTVDALLMAPPGFPVHLVGFDARDYALFEIVIAMADRMFEIRDGGFSIRTRSVAPSERFANYRELRGVSERPGAYASALPCALDNIIECIEGRESPACGLDDAEAVEAFCQTLIDKALTSADREIAT